MITKNKTKTILFDLDGTLIDHFDAVLKTYLHVHKSLGSPNNHYQFNKKSLGNITPITLKELVGEHLLAQAIPLFEEYYTSVLNEDLKLIPGVTWLLENLLSFNYTLAVFTNKPTRYAISNCKTLKIDHYFNHIIGSNEHTLKKPEKAFSEYALKQTNSCSTTTALIGDSTFDVDAAHVIGIPIYSVVTGTHTREELLSHPNQPTQIFENMYELGQTLFKFPNPKEQEIPAISYTI